MLKNNDNKLKVKEKYYKWEVALDLPCSQIGRFSIVKMTFLSTKSNIQIHCNLLQKFQSSKKLERIVLLFHMEM